MLLTFEGVDGCGKTTLINKVRDALLGAGRPIIVTSELGRSEPWSIRARNTLLAAKDAEEELNAIMRARVIHLYEILEREYLGPEPIILMDRYLLSTLAYQGRPFGVPMQDIITRHQRISLHRPDITFLLSAAPETIMDRLSRKGAGDRFDNANQQEICDRAFRFRVASGMMGAKGWRVVTVNADRSIEEMLAQVLRCISQQVVAA